MTILSRGFTIVTVAPTVCFLLSSLQTTTYLVATLVFLAAYEWQSIIPHIVSPTKEEIALPQTHPLVSFPTLVALVRAGLTAGCCWFPSPSYHILVLLLAMIFPSLMVTTDHFPANAILLRLVLQLSGYVWIGIGMSYSVRLYDDFGMRACMLVLVGNWLNDAGALIAGKMCQILGVSRYKLLPAVSPSKTLEGAVVGVALNALTIGFGVADGFSVSALLVGVILGFLGVIGDLVESLMKRSACIKDTGKIFPGHGGVLDRIDGLLLVYPTAYVLLQHGLWA
eukprot:PhF_6_TR4312/c0_g1_i1/m.5815/K00981/E2.7.7.41, CDS1, CDS2, cdsA; phosphatidate cytidylyltransferase